MERERISAALAAGAPGGAGLLFPEGGQDEFWRQANEADDYRDIVAEIREEGRRLLGEPILEPTYAQFAAFERTGHRLAYERAYFAKRRRLNTMALLTLLEPGNEAYRGALQDIVWSICGEYTWCLPAHLRGSAETDGGQAFAVESPEWSRRERDTCIDLFAAETGFALAEISVLTDGALPPLLRSRIEEEVVGRLFKPYLRQGPYFWETADHNWAAVCAGSVASAAMLLLPGSEALTAIVGKAIGTMEHYLAGFGADGACLEGIGYWNYGFGYYTYFADLLKQRTKGGIDLFRGDKVRRIAEFQQKAYLDGATTVNFSDSAGQAYVQIGLSHYLAGLYPGIAVPPDALRAPYADDHCSRWAHALRNVLWFDPALRGADWADGDYYLPDAQWLVGRKTTGRGRFGFAAKAGRNDEPHNHNDIGQFILTADGETFVCDLGSGEYTADYFGAGRYAYACNGSQGHSVPAADGYVQAEGARSAARDVTASIGEEADELRLELADAYRAPGLHSLSRRLEWRKTELPLLMLEDECRFGDKPGTFAERVVTRLEPVLRGDGRVTLQGSAGRRLVIAYDAGELEASVGTHVMRGHDGMDTVWHAVDFASRRPKTEHRVRLEFQFE
ncbi:heparinase II/III domain-containing protein [Paenibacillus sp. GCM10023250]|uniref:heparinase II/III domain-containing protein n=1 Tax=Paenibacillus sp. GCM10023250 TaxID=3252648 RepID=UPI00360A189C